jgi:nitrate reductase alpha subunit
VALRDLRASKRNPVADRAQGRLGRCSLIDYNIRAERMGWLPSAPQLKTNPLEVAKRPKGRRRGKDYSGLCGRG